MYSSTIIKYILFLNLLLEAPWSRLSNVEAAPPESLQLVHVIFRHGTRAPDLSSTKSYPKDTYINQTYPPYGPGQLTPKGKILAYNIGKYISKTYKEFLPAQYNLNVVSALSTNFRRTKLTLQLVISALYPTKSRNSIPFEPMPTSYETNHGILGVPIIYCANYIRTLFKYILTRKAQSEMEPYRKFYEKIEEYTGLEIDSALDVSYIYDVLLSQEEYGLKLPDWTRHVYPKELERASTVYFDYLTAIPALMRQCSGLVKKILDDSILKAQGKLPADRKLYLYSGHDTTIATVLQVLNVFHKHVPPFGATIFMELHRFDGDYFIKVLYQDYKRSRPRVLVIPGCSEYCNLFQLYDKLKDIFPTENDVCENSNEF